MKKIFRSLRSNQKKLQKLTITEIADVFQALSDHFMKPSIRKKLMKKLPDISGFSNEMCLLGLDVLSQILNKKSILTRLNGEFGNYKYLDEFRRDINIPLKKIARPLGVILHIAPANVFLGIADSIIMAFITKNASLVKLSSRDKFFPTFFKKSLELVDKEGIVSSCLELIEADHDSKDLIKCCEYSDAILFWGGKQAEEHFRRITPDSVKLISNGPRYSIAFIEEDAMTEKDYEGLARDTIMWEQQACSSPQILYIIGNTENTCRKLSLKISNLLIKLPPKQLSLDEKIELLKIREDIRMNCVIEGLKWPSEFINEKFALLPLIKDKIKPSPLHRSLYIKKIESVNEFFKCVSSYSDFLQTLGIKLSSKNMKRFKSLVVNSGFTRIVPPGGMCEGLFGAPHDGHYLLHQLTRIISLEEETDSTLKELLFFASQKSKYYKKIIKPDMKLEDIPLLDRNTMLKISPPISKDILTGPISDGFYFCSGGSTGNPKYSFYTNGDFDISTDLLTDIYRNAGLKSTDTVANLFIAGNLWTSFLVVNQALKNIGCINLPIGGNTRIEDMAQYILKFKPNAIVGLPSIIISLAEYFHQHKLKSSIRKILYGGEHFTNESIAFLKKAFGVESIHSAGYAIVDSGPIGVQCEYLTNSLHHAIPEYNHIEFIKDGKPVLDGEIGEIVVTNLSRRLMPVIRFKTGDLGRKIITKEACPCGNKSFIFELLGRCDDILVIGGMNLQYDDISRAIAKVDGLSSIFQLTADKYGHKELLTITIESCSDISITEKSEILKEILKEEAENIFFSIEKGLISLNINIVPAGSIKRIPRTGKIKRIIDKRR